MPQDLKRDMYFDVDEGGISDSRVAIRRSYTPELESWCGRMGTYGNTMGTGRNE